VLAGNEFLGLLINLLICFPPLAFSFSLRFWFSLDQLNASYLLLPTTARKEAPYASLDDYHVMLLLLLEHIADIFGFQVFDKVEFTPH
jgi:hypothetical protein